MHEYVSVFSVEAAQDTLWLRVFYKGPEEDLIEMSDKFRFVNDPRLHQSNPRSP